jgi:hypothetical protein
VNTSISYRSGRFQSLAGGLLLLACGVSTGCQIDVSGQTLPSPYHLSDDVQYYAPGPEFKLANEATALAEQRALEISEPQVEGALPPQRPLPAVRPAPAPPAPVVPPLAR